jgi:dienelactone hydrolase
MRGKEEPNLKEKIDFYLFRIKYFLEEKMKPDLKKNVTFLIVLVVIIAFGAIMAHYLERDFGKIDIEDLRLETASGDVIAAKLYRPVWVTPENPAPAILNMHGYQNDKEVQAGYSVELARRGFVVIATDGLGHGDSGGAFNFGLFFADPTIAMGTNAAYQYMKSLPFVDTSNLGLTGHSMGGITSFAIAGLNDDVKAIVSQDGGLGTPENSDVLFLYPTMPDMSGTMLSRVPVDPEAFGLTGEVEWNTTYGNFADGTARRAQLIWGNHHLMSLSPKAVSEAVDWFGLSLMDGMKDSHWIDSSEQVYMWKEIGGLIALLGTIVSLIPLTNILLTTSFFSSVAGPMPNRYVAPKGQWWIFATLNALIGGALYLVTANYNSVLEKVPFMKLLMGNGTAFWFLINAVVAVVLISIWYFTSGKKAGVTSYDLGYSFDKEKVKFDWKILGKTLLLGVILFAWMYILEGISQWALGEEFRFAWPFMRQFSRPIRVEQFFIYLIPALIFFLINGGVFLFGQARQPVYASKAKTQWIWWLKNLYASLMGIALVWGLQYLPWMVANAGPFFQMTVNPSWAIWPLMLWVYIPEFIVLLFMLTWFYRRTGKIYLGALMIASLATWFVAAGSVLGV